MSKQKKKEWEEKNNLKVETKVTLTQKVKEICKDISEGIEISAERKYIQKKLGVNNKFIGKEPGE